VRSGAVALRSRRESRWRSYSARETGDYGRRPLLCGWGQQPKERGQKKRKGRNPTTGEEITIAAEPASVDLRDRLLAKAKTSLPSVQKARRRLAA
jgi:hypothetical protein